VQARVQEEIRDVLEPTLDVVDEVFALARTEEPPGDRDNNVKSSVFGNEPPSRTNSRETLASEPGPASWVPENITSFMADALRDLADCSPRAHLTASMMLLLPHPLGPAMQVTPLDTARVVFFAIDLKPLISILDNFTPQALAELDGHRKRPDDPWWNTRKSLAFRARNLHIRS